MKTMIAKYPGTCAACNKPISRGELIIWHGKGRAEHSTQCVAPAENPIVGKCWLCNNPAGKFRNLGAATPVWCDDCFSVQTSKQSKIANVRFNAGDNSSHEDSSCGDIAYEDSCARACGL